MLWFVNKPVSHCEGSTLTYQLSKCAHCRGVYKIRRGSVAYAELRAKSNCSVLSSVHFYYFLATDVMMLSLTCVAAVQHAWPPVYRCWISLPKQGHCKYVSTTCLVISIQLYFGQEKKHTFTIITQLPFQPFWTLKIHCSFSLSCKCYRSHFPLELHQ